MSRRNPVRLGNGHPNIVPYQVFDTADAPMILAVGNDGQFRKFCECADLPDLPNFIVDPRYATNVARVEHRDQLCEQIGQRLRKRPRAEGTKHWITGASVSRLHLVFTRVKEQEEAGIVGFIVQGPGVPEISIRQIYAMGIRRIPEGAIQFENIEVSVSMMLRPPGGLARGFAAPVNAYNAQRVTAATVALAIAQGAFGLALAYAKGRIQFGHPIVEFQGIQWMRADMSPFSSKLLARSSTVPRAAMENFRTCRLGSKRKSWLRTWR